MTTEEWIAAIDAKIVPQLDALIDQMREILRELVPPEDFEEWDRKACAAQHRSKS